MNVGSRPRVDADGSGRAGGVRTVADPSPDRRGAGKGDGEGVRFGRKLKLTLTPHQIAEAKARREAGEALTDIGRSYNVSHSTISSFEERKRACCLCSAAGSPTLSHHCAIALAQTKSL
jgi:hypothetical protein